MKEIRLKTWTGESNERLLMFQTSVWMRIVILPSSRREASPSLIHRMDAGISFTIDALVRDEAFGMITYKIRPPRTLNQHVETSFKTCQLDLMQIKQMLIDRVILKFSVRRVLDRNIPVGSADGRGGLPHSTTSHQTLSQDAF